MSKPSKQRKNALPEMPLQTACQFRALPRNDLPEALVQGFGAVVVAETPKKTGSKQKAAPNLAHSGLKDNQEMARLGAADPTQKTSLPCVGCVSQSYYVSSEANSGGAGHLNQQYIKIGLRWILKRYELLARASFQARKLKSKGKKIKPSELRQQVPVHFTLQQSEDREAALLSCAPNAGGPHYPAFHMAARGEEPLMEQRAFGIPAPIWTHTPVYARRSDVKSIGDIGLERAIAYCRHRRAKAHTESNESPCCPDCKPKSSGVWVREYVTFFDAAGNATQGETVEYELPVYHDGSSAPAAASPRAGRKRKARKDESDEESEEEEEEDEEESDESSEATEESEAPPSPKRQRTPSTPAPSVVAPRAPLTICVDPIVNVSVPVQPQAAPVIELASPVPPPVDPAQSPFADQFAPPLEHAAGDELSSLEWMDVDSDSESQLPLSPLSVSSPFASPARMMGAGYAVEHLEVPQPKPSIEALLLPAAALYPLPAQIDPMHPYKDASAPTFSSSPMQLQAAAPQVSNARAPFTHMHGFSYQLMDSHMHAPLMSPVPVSPSMQAVQTQWPAFNWPAHNHVEPESFLI